MEGKTLVLCVLIMSLVMAQIQVEAAVKCPNAAARSKYDACLMKGGSIVQCAQLAGCRLQAGDKSPRSLVMAPTQEVARVCCPSKAARNVYDRCRLPLEICAQISGCIILPEHAGPCPSDFPEDNLQHSDDAVNEYCKLGCASSVCGALTTLRNSDTSEVVNGAVEKCAKACSTFCTKGSMNALETS